MVLMSESDNIYNTIQKLLGNIQGNIAIMEQQIDADVQIEYFDYMNKLNADFNHDEVLKHKDHLFRHDLAIEDKKYLMVQLANIDNVDAYRTLEKYLLGPDTDLKDWAILALQENKLLLESRLLGENHVMILTGLGGKGLKLRYFTVLITSNGKAYSAFEKEILTKEVKFLIKKSNGDLEHIHFDEELCTLLSVIPLQVPVQKLFSELIHECNQYGNFLNSDFMITNVRIISNDQIRRLVKQTKCNNKASKP
jgi:uncharacterized protein YbgA (DUF1722 family)